MDKKSDKKTFDLSWYSSDIEGRIGLGLFSPARFTDTNIFLSFLLGCVLFAILYSALFVAAEYNLYLANIIYARMYSGGWISQVTLLLFCWGWVVLWLKSKKLKLQRKALNLPIVPQNTDFVLNQNTATAILKRLRDIVDNSKNFVLLNRIEIAISNLNNIGQIGDVATILSAQERTDEERVGSSYIIVNTLMWIIPILGFIGTVLGLGLAIGGFTETISGAQDLSKIKDSLGGVTGGLSTAFDTTLVALVLVVVLQFYSAIVQRREYGFLDECSAYCQDNILSKLRIEKKEEI